MFHVFSQATFARVPRSMQRRNCCNAFAGIKNDSSGWIQPLFGQADLFRAQRGAVAPRANPVCSAAVGDVGAANDQRRFIRSCLGLGKSQAQGLQVVVPFWTSRP